MAETSLGKKFEAVFKRNWENCFPNELVFRLVDQMGGFSGIGGSNPCDFFAHAKGKTFMIEVKEHKGASINWAAIRQRDKLIDYYHKNYKDIYQGVLIWFSEKDLVIYVPASELEKMVADGEKSVGIRMLESDYKKSYNIIVVPSEKKRVFMESDYNYLYNKIVEKE